MNRRKFVVVSTVMMAVLAAAVAGMALYSSYVVKASIPALPEALAWLPADTQAVFGMNVQKFVASPIYARFEEKHGRDRRGPAPGHLLCCRSRSRSGRSQGRGRRDRGGSFQYDRDHHVHPDPWESRKG